MTLHSTFFLILSINTSYNEHCIKFFNIFTKLNKFNSFKSKNSIYLIDVVLHIKSTLNELLNFNQLFIQVIFLMKSKSYK